MAHRHPRSEVEHTVSHPDTSCATSPWTTTWSWHKGSGPTTTRGRRRLHTTCRRLLLGRVRQTRTTCRYTIRGGHQGPNMVTLLILDSWVLMMKSRLCHLRDLRAHCPERCFELPPPPAEELTIPSLSSLPPPPSSLPSHTKPHLASQWREYRCPIGSSLKACFKTVWHQHQRCVHLCRECRTRPQYAVST